MESHSEVEFRSVPLLRFPGWWTIIAGAVQASVGYGWRTYGWTVFVRFFRRDLEWTSAMIGLLSSVGRITNIPAAPAGGWSADNWGPRYASAIWLTAMSLGWVWCALMQNYWEAFIFYSVILYGTGAGGLYRISYTAANRWWMDRRAMAIATIALGGRHRRCHIPPPPGHSHRGLGLAGSRLAGRCHHFHRLRSHRLALPQPYAGALRAVCG